MTVEITINPDLARTVTVKTGEAAPVLKINHPYFDKVKSIEVDTGIVDRMPAAYRNTPDGLLAQIKVDPFSPDQVGRQVHRLGRSIVSNLDSQLPTTQERLEDVGFQVTTQIGRFKYIYNQMPEGSRDFAYIALGRGMVECIKSLGNRDTKFKAVRKQINSQVALRTPNAGLTYNINNALREDQLLSDLYDYNIIAEIIAAGTNDYINNPPLKRGQRIIRYFAQAGGKKAAKDLIKEQRVVHDEGEEVVTRVKATEWTDPKDWEEWFDDLSRSTEMSDSRNPLLSEVQVGQIARVLKTAKSAERQALMHFVRGKDFIPQKWREGGYGMEIDQDRLKKRGLLLEEVLIDDPYLTDLNRYKFEDSLYKYVVTTIAANDNHVPNVHQDLLADCFGSTVNRLYQRAHIAESKEHTEFNKKVLSRALGEVWLVDSHYQLSSKGLSLSSRLSRKLFEADLLLSDFSDPKQFSSTLPILQRFTALEQDRLLDQSDLLIAVIDGIRQLPGYDVRKPKIEEKREQFSEQVMPNIINTVFHPGSVIKSEEQDSRHRLVVLFYDKNQNLGWAVKIIKRVADHNPQLNIALRNEWHRRHNEAA